MLSSMGPLLRWGRPEHCCQLRTPPSVSMHDHQFFGATWGSQCLLLRTWVLLALSHCLNVAATLPAAKSSQPSMAPAVASASAANGGRGYRSLLPSDARYLARRGREGETGL